MRHMKFLAAKTSGKGRPFHFVSSTLISFLIHHILRNLFLEPTAYDSVESHSNPLNIATSICKKEDILRGYATINSIFKSIKNSAHSGNINIFVFVSVGLQLQQNSIRDEINSLLIQLPLKMRSKIAVNILPATYPSEVAVHLWTEPSGGICSCFNIRRFLPSVLLDINEIAFINSGSLMSADLIHLWKQTDKIQSAIELVTMRPQKLEGNNEGMVFRGKLSIDSATEFPEALIIMDLSKLRKSKWEETLAYCPETSSSGRKCSWMRCSISSSNYQCYALTS